jgi:hypothetical protein
MADKELTGRDWALGCGCLTAIVVAIGIAVTVSSSGGGKSSSTAPPTVSDTATGGTGVFLPRLHNETGAAALTAYCRDMWFTQHSRSVGVDVAFTGPGNVTVNVLPKPGDGTGQQTQEYTIGSTEAGHHFAFSGVAGQVDRVQVTVTAARGVDQCYARRR